MVLKYILSVCLGVLAVHKALDQHDYWTMSLSFWWPTSQGLAPEWGIIQVTLCFDFVLPSSSTAFKGCRSTLPSSERLSSPWIRYQPIVVLTHKNSHILRSMWSLQCTVPQKSLGRGRRPEHPERTCTNVGRTYDPPHRKGPGGQGHFCSGWEVLTFLTFLLWGDCTTHNVSPCWEI